MADFKRIREAADPLEVLNAPMEAGLIPQSSSWTGRWDQQFARLIGPGDVLQVSIFIDEEHGETLPDEALEPQGKLLGTHRWRCGVALEEENEINDYLKRIDPVGCHPLDVAADLQEDLRKNRARWLCITVINLSDYDVEEATSCRYESVESELYDRYVAALRIIAPNDTLIGCDEVEQRCAGLAVERRIIGSFISERFPGIRISTAVRHQERSSTMEPCRKHDYLRLALLEGYRPGMGREALEREGAGTCIPAKISRAVAQKVLLGEQSSKAIEQGLEEPPNISGSDKDYNYRGRKIDKSLIRRLGMMISKRSLYAWPSTIFEKDNLSSDEFGCLDDIGKLQIPPTYSYWLFLRAAASAYRRAYDRVMTFDRVEPFSLDATGCVRIEMPGNWTLAGERQVRCRHSCAEHDAIHSVSG